MPRELELKLEVDVEGAQKLRDHVLLAQRSARSGAQLSVYFDTKGGKLRKAGYTLRVRRTDSGFVQTIKAAGAGAGLFDRPEWEAPVAKLLPDPGAAAATPLAALLTARVQRKLVPVAKSKMVRTSWLVDHEASSLELILDEGTIQAGRAKHKLLEVEIEVREGSPASAISFAQLLGAQVPVRLGVLTKAERGFALADGMLERASKASPVYVEQGMSVAEGFTAIIHACLRHFRLNEPLLAEKRSAAALHQARVALRRLRSALSLFRPAVRDARFDLLRDELRWFTGQLGEARNLDVFLDRTKDRDIERPRLEASRDQAYSAIIESLSSQRFRDLLLNLLAWVESGEWRDGRKAGRPLAAFTARRIDSLWIGIEAAGATLATLPEEPRHRLRIEIKKLRYALEFVGELHRAAGPRRKRFMTALEALQEDLGHLNDLSTARTIAADSLPEERSSDQSAAPDRKEEADYLTAAERGFRRLQKVGPFWHDVGSA